MTGRLAWDDRIEVVEATSPALPVYSPALPVLLSPSTGEGCQGEWVDHKQQRSAVTVQPSRWPRTKYQKLRLSLGPNRVSQFHTTCGQICNGQELPAI